MLFKNIIHFFRHELFNKKKEEPKEEEVVVKEEKSIDERVDDALDRIVKTVPPMNKKLSAADLIRERNERRKQVIKKIKGYD